LGKIEAYLKIGSWVKY